MYVYTIEYGNVDQEETFSSVWKEKEDALKAAIETADEVLEDLAEEEQSYTKAVRDFTEDGQTHICVVIVEDREYERDWWRIKQQELR